VEDDGVGFDPGGAASAGDQGFGLLGMQERAALIGATLQIESSPGSGTTIFVRMAVGAPVGKTADRG
jgi:two-component system sensor histidine kinase UhpB